jgi:hypothetical protein
MLLYVVFLFLFRASASKLSSDSLGTNLSNVNRITTLLPFTMEASILGVFGRGTKVKYSLHSHLAVRNGKWDAYRDTEPYLYIIHRQGCYCMISGIANNNNIKQKCWQNRSRAPFAASSSDAVLSSHRFVEMWFYPQNSTLGCTI